MHKKLIHSELTPLGYDPLPLALGAVKLHLKIARALVECYGVSVTGAAQPLFVFSAERTA